MNDNDLLDLIADRAPEPASDYADRMLAVGRNARRRRRRLVGAGVAVCAIVIVLAPLLTWSVPGERHTTTATSTAPSGVDTGAMYSMAVRLMVSQAMPAATVARVKVLDQLCENVLAVDEPCAASPMPPEARDALSRLRVPTVDFVPGGGWAPGDSTILITLGPIRWVRDDVAEVSVSFRQAGQEPIARTYRIQLDGQSWILTG